MQKLQENEAELQEVERVKNAFEKEGRISRKKACMNKDMLIKQATDNPKTRMFASVAGSVDRSNSSRSPKNDSTTNMNE